jgi:hypothetical protein
MQTGVSVLFMQTNDCLALNRQNFAWILQIVKSAQHYIDSMVWTVYVDKCLLYLIWIGAVLWVYADDDICIALCRQFCWCFYADKCLLCFTRIVIYAQIHAGGNICMGSCKQDCLYYLCRHTFALLYTDSNYWTEEICWWWHLHGVLQTRLSDLLMQTKVCSALYW